MGNGNIGNKINFNKQNRNIIENFINDLVCIKCLLFLVEIKNNLKLININVNMRDFEFFKIHI